MTYNMYGHGCQLNINDQIEPFKKN